jgi:hypothetical protein
MPAISRWLWTILLPAALLPAIAGSPGCSPPVESGFLAPYNGFHRSSALSTNLQYVDPDAGWKRYSKVRIFTVSLYYAPGAQVRVGPKDAAALTSFFEQKLLDAFGKDYRVVSNPGPDVLDVRVALTNLRPTDVVKNAAARAAGVLLPMAYDLGLEGYKHLTGDQLGMGEAQVEAEFRDSVSQRRLYGLVARNVGSSLDIPGQTSAWGVVETAMSKWARALYRQLRYRQDPTQLNKLLAEVQ